DRERMEVELALQRVELLLGRLIQPDPDEPARLVPPVVGVLELALAVAPYTVLVDRAVDDHCWELSLSRRPSSTASSRPAMSPAYAASSSSASTRPSSGAGSMPGSR